MGKRTKEVDAYIAKSPAYARPILTYIRDVVHETCPDVEETLKWSAPTFMHHGIMCGMASFKEYAALHFWKNELVVPGTKDASGGPTRQLGKLASVKDLPPKKVLQGYIRKAMELNEQGVKTPKAPAKKKKAFAMPDYFMTAIKKNKKALAAYEGFSPSHQREYIEWIVSAKGEDTRDRRVEQAVEWMAEGKPRNWKYMR
jgi:uncharacterized protein YdeI (YjbR/CyaY-like superfamily)